MHFIHFSYTLWNDIMGMSHPASTCSLFDQWIHLLSMCRIQWSSQTTAALRYPLINLIWHSIVFFFFPLVNSSTAVIRSVYFPLAGLSHVGHWLECTKWVTEQPLGSREVRWFYCWMTLSHDEKVIGQVLQMAHVSSHVCFSFRIFSMSCSYKGLSFKTSANKKRFFVRIN